VAAALAALAFVAAAHAVEFERSASDSYENSYYPLAVGNYWVYKRPNIEGFTLLREEIVGTFEDEGSTCFKTEFRKTVHKDKDDPGSLFVEGKNCYCYVGGSVFNMCVRCERERDREPYWFVPLKMDDPTIAVLKLPKFLKLDQNWVDMPYPDQLTRFTVIGAEEVCLHELNKTFQNCIKVRRDVTLEPRLDGFDWYCPGVGLVKSEFEKFVARDKTEVMRSILVDYHVK